MAAAAGKDTVRQADLRENLDLAQCKCSVEVVDEAAKQRLCVKEESYKAYIEEELSLRKCHEDIHQVRLRRHWAAGEWCWCWKSGNHRFQNEGWCVPWSSPCVTSRNSNDR